jgi:hypothetical protein
MDTRKSVRSVRKLFAMFWFLRLNSCRPVDENGSTPRFILNHAMKLGGNTSAATPKAATESSPSQKRKVASVSILLARGICPFAESSIF